MVKLLYITFLCFLLFSIILSVFFFTQVIERNRQIDDLYDDIDFEENVTDIDQIAVQLSNEIFRRTNRVIDRSDLDPYSSIETFSFFNMTSSVSLEFGTYGVFKHRQLGPCGTMSRTLLNALWRLNIPARKLQLLENARGEGGGHTMIEFFHDGQWRVLSPSDNSFVWRRPDGTIATARDIQNDEKIFSQIFDENPDFPYLFDNYSNIRWEKLPSGIRTVIKMIIGEERYHSARTPRLYDLPRNLFLLISISFSVVFGSLTIAGRQRLRKIAP